MPVPTIAIASGMTVLRHFILATAGHVDHGKSTLVRMLTGTDPDRLPEEKSRGMTIDLGFAELSPDPSISIGIVDVPGHEDFVRNMIAGVGAIDAALLVVAADDGWMPQTDEHVRILRYLGVTRGIVALSKADCVSDIAAATSALRVKLAGTFLERVPIIPTSMHRPIDPLREAIVAMFADVPPPVDIGKPRLQVDRSFLLRGVGRIVTGTLSGGTISRGQEIALTPAGVRSKVRTIQSHNRELAVASPGMRVALNLPDLPHDDDYRGQTVTLPRLAAAHDVLDVALIVSLDGALHLLAGEVSDAVRATRLRRGGLVQVHHGTASVAGRLYSFADPALAQLRLESPLPAFVGDRLVLRDAGHRWTLAGAIVLDASAHRGGMRSEARARSLKARAENLGDAGAIVRAIAAARSLVPEDSILIQSHFSEESLAAATAPLRRGHCIVDPVWWSGWLDELSGAVRAHHAAHPEQAGLQLSKARSLPIGSNGAEALFDVAIDDLAARGIVRSGAILRERSHRPALPPRLQSAGARLRAVLEAHPMDPPTRSELAPDAISQQALAFLKINGEVIELSQMTFISAAAFETARESVIELLRSRGRATVAELKTAMATSRRIAVPLLEKLDRDGVTRREGDVRTLRLAETTIDNA